MNVLQKLESCRDYENKSIVFVSDILQLTSIIFSTLKNVLEEKLQQLRVKISSCV